MTPAGTSIDVQNGWEENTHTHTVANPARGLLNKGKKTEKRLAAPPPPSKLLVRRKIHLQKLLTTTASFPDVDILCCWLLSCAFLSVRFPAFFPSPTVVIIVSCRCRCCCRFCCFSHSAYCLPTRKKSTLLHRSQYRSWSSAEQGEKKEKSLAAPPPPTLLVRRKIHLRTTRRIYLSRRYYASRRNAGLGPSRIRTRMFLV